MNPLDSYLAKVARELRALPPSKRDDELRELRSHLEQRVEDFEQGLDSQEAQRQAILTFGAPKHLGSQLADAWEGIPFSWWRVAATCCVTTTIWIAASFIVGLSMTLGGTFSPVGALFPELFPLIMAFYLSVPPLCGALFTHWQGRHGRLFALIHFTLIFWVFNLNLHYDTRTPSRMAEPSAFFINYVNSAWTPLLTIVLSLAGACLSHALRTRTRVRLTETNGFILNSPPARLLRIPFNLKSWLYATALCTTILLLGGARVWSALHPSTPSATLRYRLVTGNISDGFEAPGFVELQELPAVTPAELAGNECRVRFQLQISAKPYFQANQLAHLKRELAAEARYGGDPRTRETIARVQSNRHTVTGIAHMKATPKGWRFDENSFNTSQLWAWFYVH